MKKRLTGLLAAIVALVSGAVLAGPNVASAQALWEFPCNGRLPVGMVSGIPVPGNRAMSLGQSLRFGQVYRIVPTPNRTNSVNYGGWWFFNAGTWGPAGKIGDPAGDFPWPVSGAPKYSLIAQTLVNGGGERFYVGSDSGCKTYQGPPATDRTLGVNLWLGVNDDNVGDNTGSYTASVLFY
jgi:hypothetical protein